MLLAAAGAAAARACARAAAHNRHDDPPAQSGTDLGRPPLQLDHSRAPECRAAPQSLYCLGFSIGRACGRWALARSPHRGPEGSPQKSPSHRTHVTTAAVGSKQTAPAAAYVHRTASCCRGCPFLFRTQEIFSLFDRLLLLTQDGRVAFFGATTDCTPPSATVRVPMHAVATHLVCALERRSVRRAAQAAVRANSCRHQLPVVVPKPAALAGALRT